MTQTDIRALAASRSAASASLASEADMLLSAAQAFDVLEAALTATQTRAADLDAQLAGAMTRQAETAASLAFEQTARATVEQALRDANAALGTMQAELAAAHDEIARLQALLDAASPPVMAFHLEASAATVDEGGVVTFNLTTQNVPTGTVVPYALSGVTPEDLDGSPMTGEFTVDANGQAFVSVRIKADATTEGLETLVLTVKGDVGPVSVLVQDTSKTPPPPPPPVEPPVVHPPLPLDAAVRYRYQHHRFLQPQSIWMPKIPNGVAYTDGMHNGATAVFIDSKIGWAWDKKGGDWVDAAGVRYGTKAWAALDISTEGEHSTDVTALVNAPGWLAMILRANSQRRIAGKASQTPPRIEAVLEDGTLQTLPCWYSGSIDGSSTVPNPSALLQQLPAILEFDKPTGPVRSAKLFLTSSGLAAAPGNVARIDFFKVDPPINKDEPTQGLAAAYPMDDGITSHPAVFGAHIYKDGSTLDQFVSNFVGNIDDERQFDPNLYGMGPEDRTKLPHRDLGKWVGAGPAWSLVDSAYRGEGFVPFADGYGALRIFMAPANPIDQPTGVRGPIHNGGQYGYDGTGAAGAKIYLPADRFGLQRRMFVRTNVRLARGDGFVDGEAGRLQVYAAAGQAKWVDHGGKTLPMPIHNRTTGGFSGSAGGGAGWQARVAWMHNDAMLGGPDEEGWALGAHLFDFQSANPPGHSYANDTPDKAAFGQRGGLGGILYYDRWYSFEAEILLNSVDQPAVLADGTPHFKFGVRQYWTPDGAWRVWIDGRLAFERTGLVFRSLPVANPGFRAGYCRPCRELGAEGIMLNWFHGGVTQNAQPRVMFLSSVVWAEERIGPTVGR